MGAVDSDLADFRAELERLLASPEFSASNQLREFLRYTSDRAFQGVSHIEQAEIASAVLGRGADFNPVEDASVRKLASLARQRLEQFYTRRGSGGRVVVTLPVRSYVPRYERRAQVLQEPIAPVPRWRRLLPVWVLACMVAVLAGILGWHRFRRDWQRVEAVEAAIILTTAKGDIAGPGSDAPPNAVRLGPMLGDLDEVSVLLNFTAQQELHQAGLLAWQDADNFIRLGRRFMGRNQLAFRMEENGSSVMEPYTAPYDPEGQSGRPLWLALRRLGSVYRGFKSTDGVVWEEVGRPLQPARAFQNVRAGIYAFNGRREVPSIPAAFSHLATGITYQGWNGVPSDEMGKGGWLIRCDCDPVCVSEFEPSALRLWFTPADKSCNWEWLRPIRSADWEITSKWDYFPAPGVAVGLGVRGKKGSVRLARYFLNGPVISLIYDGKTLVGVSDFNGSPALFLRLRARAGILAASYSVDGMTFHRLPPEIRVDELGGELRAGLRLTANDLSHESRLSAARIFFYRESIGRLEPYRK